MTGTIGSTATVGFSVSAASFSAIALRATGANGREYRLVSTDDTNGLGGSQLIVYNQTNNAVVNRCDYSYNFVPGGDNNRSLGTLQARWSVVYAGAGTINTSDAREKTPIRPLTSLEKAAGLALGRELGGFHFLSSTSMDTSIEHIGMTVQRAIEILEAHDLIASNYAFVVHESWPATPEVTWQTDPEYDLEGNLIRPPQTIVIEPAKPAGDRYGFRMDQLLAFVMRAICEQVDLFLSANGGAESAG
ncbi:hypothetical protein Xtri_13590 [Xanthomonas campestris pv. trichodesmae]|uniref:Peptidase S74 domain-containing protein n=3 Tax=Xanthomonas citri TaxID=346 RepID=A0AB33CEU0_XANCI|nr:hypothetical protein XcvCFBP7111P_15000 [Xanthomonas citri pv. vignicola]MBZ3920441.1 hypothetical protein [Xanthomonas campestris pv. trichodesmae]MBZ3923790.1 hypothetical protein [Xanthomonas citri pv. sesbaniae]